MQWVKASISYNNWSPSDGKEMVVDGGEEEKNAKCDTEKSF